MGFTTSNLSLYHTFSKTPVDSNTSSAAAQLGNAINKSGHTVQSNEIWTESIPFFGLAATTTAIHTKFSATAKVNDLVKDSDGKIWQRNSTAYSQSATFDNLWSEKTKSITSFTKGTDGKYTFTEADGALVDGSYLLNSEGVPTVKYYEKRLLTRLTADNNANTNSDNKASRLQIAGKWIDQFIGVTDIYLNGSAAVSYAPVLRKTESSSPMQSGPGKAYMDYCATGLILWESSAAGTEVIDCFEYVGAKLNSTVAKLEAAVFGGSPGEGGEEDLSISEQVAQNTIAINVLNGADTVEGSVAKTVKDAIDGLGDVAVKSDITITDIKVKQGSGEPNSLTITDKSVTIEIPEVPAADVTKDGVVTTDGFTKTADVTNLANAAINAAISDTDGAIADAIDSAISDATLPDSEKIATATDTSKLVTVEDVTTYVSENAKVTLTQGTGITVTPNGQASTSFTIAVDNTVATKQSVDDLSDVVSGVAQTVTDIQTSLSTGSIATAIQTAQDTADEAKGIAETAIQKVKVNGTELTKSGTEVDITAIVGVDETATNGIKVTKTTDNKVKVNVTPASYTKKDGETPGIWGDDKTNFVTAQTVIDAISDIDFPDVKVDGSSRGYGISFSSHDASGAFSTHYMHIATATYTPAVGETDASWTEKGYLVTGSTVETFVGAEVGKVANDLATLESKVNAYHEAGISYKVHDSQTLPDLSVAENVENYKNVILLVPSTAPGDQTDDATAAITGGYVEWLCVKTGETTYAWEQIGTTEADLHGYVNFIEGPTANVLANRESVYASISSNGYLTLGVASASDTVMGVSKMFSGNYWELPSNVTDTAVSTLTASAMFSNMNDMLATKADAKNVVNSINGVKGAVNLCVHNYQGGQHINEGTSVSNAETHANLWGMTFTNNGFAELVLVDDFVGMSNSYLTTANLPSEAVSVENNFVYDASGTVITTIRPERMVSGFNAISATGLTSFVGDLNNLETSYDNLQANVLTSFYGCSALETFIGDLSSLKDGCNMFSGCSSLTTFIGDLNSLERGALALEYGGTGMFSRTALTVESVENIADTLPENPVVDVNIGVYKGCIIISWQQLTSDTAERQELVDALSGVVDKGWALVTNSELHAMFDREKYQVVQNTV